MIYFLVACSHFLLFLGYKENNEELQAQLVSKSLEEGRTLLNHANNNSLAAEFEAMSENEVTKATGLSWLQFYVGVEMVPSLSTGYKIKVTCCLHFHGVVGSNRL